MLPCVRRTNKGIDLLTPRKKRRDMKRTKQALGAAALALLILSAQACGPSLTEPDTDPDTAICLWINGILQCLE